MPKIILRYLYPRECIVLYAFSISSIEVEYFFVFAEISEYSSHLIFLQTNSGR
jgi:hypothetical protein